MDLTAPVAVGPAMAPPGPGTRPLVRREGLERLVAAADRAAGGQTTVVSVTGAIGAGRSTLLELLRDHVRDLGFLTLATQGHAADAEVGFSSLMTLLRPLQTRSSEDELSAAVASALALQRSRTDPAAVRLGTHRAITQLADRQPVLITIDDAHLLDRSSAEVIAFVIGRCVADPVVAVFTTELGAPTALDPLATEDLVLGPVGESSLAAMVRAEVDIAPEPLSRCVGLAEGNPLAAIELARSLDPDERAGHAPMPALPRPAGALARAFTRRVSSLSEPARRAVALVAADDTGDTQVVSDALERLGESTDGLVEAEWAGLVDRHGTHIGFTHPLLRPVAYHQVAESSRQAAHRSLAAVLDQPHQGSSRAWQLAAGADGPDENAAAALEAVAADLEGRGASSSAATTLELAARLSPDPSRRRVRLVGATRCWLTTGDPGGALRSADALTQLDPDGNSVAVATVALRAGRGIAASLACARDACGLDDDGSAKAVLAAELLEAGAVDEAVATARAVIGGSRPVAMAAGVLALAGGEPAPAVARTESGALADRARALTTAAAVSVGRPDRALAERNPPGALGGPGLDISVSHALGLLGRGELAAADAELLRLEATVTEPSVALRGHLDLALAELDLLFGRLESAEERSRRTAIAASAAGLGWTSAAADWVRGRVHLALGDPVTAVDPLRTACRLAPHVRAADLVTAMAGADLPAEASRIAASIHHHIDHADPAIAVRAVRAAGTADPSGPGFAVALERAEAADLPLEAAEVVVAWAEAARRAGDTSAARQLADRAEQRLVSLGVRAWQIRIDAARSGDVDAAPALTDLLTPAEHRVALAVAEGGTNRDVADALFLSVKTVDFHLRNIYRKLDLRSRTELAVLVHGDGRSGP
ncbi:MAG: LuxR C-terminal-related transcriptional regulator [Acidimicrobiales bacterium]|nr:LuxR C-terminal-related transcriptional regulator [Acidimicrobiales bacterium]